MSWPASRGRTTFVSVLLLIALVGLAAFIASPWHQHSRLSTQPCAYTAFEHASSTGESVLAVPTAPALETVALWIAAESRPSEPTFALPAPVRAPPSILVLT